MNQTSWVIQKHLSRIEQHHSYNHLCRFDIRQFRLHVTVNIPILCGPISWKRLAAAEKFIRFSRGHRCERRRPGPASRSLGAGRPLCKRCSQQSSSADLCPSPQDSEPLRFLQAWERPGCPAYLRILATTLQLVSLLSRDCGAQPDNHRAYGHQNYQPPKLAHQFAQSNSSNMSGWSFAHRHPICSRSTCNNHHVLNSIVLAITIRNFNNAIYNFFEIAFS